REEVVGGAGAVELDRVETDREVTVRRQRRNYPRLGGRRVDRGIRVAGDHGVEVQIEPTEVEVDGQGSAADLDALRLCRADVGVDAEAGRVGALRSRLRVLLLVEHQDTLLDERAPARVAAASRAGEELLIGLRVAPAQEAGAGRERPAVEEAGGEVRRQRLAVVGRVGGGGVDYG